ncbi:MAG: iron-containing alcohol dehydrogenase, partial [Cyanobacteria bacterium P01_A01_bin.105]
LEGIYLVAQHLKDAVHFAQQGGDPATHLTARAGMLNASMMGAIAFQKGLGVTHSCAHALSTVCDTHHGLANAVMLPAAMRFNLDAAPEKFLRMARVVNPGATRGTDLIRWIQALAQEIGIPAALVDIGVLPETLDQLVPVAMADGCHPLNPKPVTETDFYALYQDALYQDAFIA